ncbi:hypothetical protein JCM9279_004358 [Rhodotorula babjevae]
MSTVPPQGTVPSPLSPRSSSKRPSPARDLDPASQNKRVALTHPAGPPAPPVPSKDVTNQPGAASGPPAAGGGAGCRLLWRGRLTTDDGKALHGVALIAHLFTVSSSLASPLPPASSLSPFDDPFSSASSNTATGADMCLGLEMLRGAPIAVKSHVRIRRAGDSPDKAAASSSGTGSAGKKGKGRARDEPEVELVEVETPTDVRVYIDARCPATVEWFEDTFCRVGRAGYGVTLDAGGEEVVLFAALPSLSNEQENLDPSSSSTSTPPSRPALTLLLGRRARATVRKPRPDDPLPRESLFANKLRKTASLPASAFSLPSSTDLAPPPAKKPKRQTAKDKVIASLLGKNDEMAPPCSRPRAGSSQPPSIAFPPPPPPSATSRPFARSASSRFPSAASTSSSASLSRQASLPPLAPAGVARRASTSGPPGRPFQRTLSRSSMLLDSPPGSDDDLAPAAPHAYPQRPSRSASRAPSPTPSLSSVLGDADDGEDAGGEGLDAVADLRSFGAARGARAKGMSRSSSLPVGQFALGGPAAAGSGEKARRAQREGTALPSAGAREGSAAPEGAMEGVVETRNKNTVKKLTLARMTALGCGKAHVEFRDVFSFTTRGVGFAMRSTFKTAVLSPAERELASSLIDQHLRLYLSSPSFPTPSPTPDLASNIVKQEPAQVALAPPRMPSPHSLGDGLDEAASSSVAATTAPAPPVADAPDDDVEMTETQPHEVEDEEPTQLHDEERASGKGLVSGLDGLEDEDDEDEADEVVLVTRARVKPEPVEG